MSATNSRQNPFPGLRPFLSHEKHLFFGRERQVAELVERLDASRFLAVVGTSGSGKSSLVRAGLLPELHGGNMVSAGSRWEVIVMRPGGGPIQNLASALLESDLCDSTSPDAVLSLIAALNHSRSGFVEAVRQSNLPRGTNLLVIVDQFEELFRFHNQLASGEEHAVDFVNLLLEASRQEGIPIYVTLTMRSDFLGDCAQFAGLAEAVNKGEYLIPRMNRDQCRLAIEGPVRVGRARIAPRLTQRLLNEIGDDPDQLPVLQHALLRTWDQWANRVSSGDAPIDLEDYEAVGTMSEALSRHADEVFLGLPNDRQRQIAERLFKALTERGVEGRGVRRPGRLAKLCQVLDIAAGELSPVIEAFRAPGRTFLMPMQSAELTLGTVIDISHESLMRVWRRLRGWVEEEAQSARIYRRLAETAALHAEGHASLYRDPDLQIALAWRDQEMPTAAWAERYHDGFSTALAFLNASSEAAQAEAVALEAARQRELSQARALAEAERQRAEDSAAHARRLKILVRGMAVALAVAIAATVLALVARNAARKSESRAKEATLRAQALQLEASRHAYASTVSLAQSLLDNGKSEEAGQALLQPVPSELRGWEYGYLLERLTHSGRLLDQGIDSTWAMAFSPDSSRLAYVLSQHVLKIRDLKTGKVLRSLDLRSTHGPVGVSGMEFSPDGKRLAAVSWTAPIGTNAWLMDAETGETTRVFPVQFLAKGLAFSPDGSTVAFGGDHSEVLLFDMNSGELVRRFSGILGSVTKLRFTADGRRLLASIGRYGRSAQSKEAAGRVWDVASGEKLYDMNGHTDGVQALAVHPSNPRAATSGFDQTLRMWNWETKTEELNLPLPDIMIQVAFTVGGSVLLAAPGATIRAYLADEGRLLREWRSHSTLINAFEISSDGRFLVSSSFDNQVKLIDLQPVTGETPLPAHQAPISTLAVSPNGKLLATAAWDQTVQFREISGWKLRATANLGRTAASLCFSPDGTSLLVPGAAGNAVALATDSGEVARIFSTGASVSLHEARIAPDGNSVATLGVDGSVTVFDWETGSIRWRRQVHGYFLDDYPTPLANSIRFSPDGRRLVTAGETDNRAQILDAASGQSIGVLEGSSAMRMASYTPDGRFIYTSSGEPGSGELTRWNATNFTRLDRLQIANPPSAILWSQDGKRFVTASGPWSDPAKPAPLHVWDAESRRSLLPIGGTNRIGQAAFIPGTDFIVGADRSGSVFIWSGGSAAGFDVEKISTNEIIFPAATSPLAEHEIAIAARPADGLPLRQLIRDSIPPPGTAPANLLDLSAHTVATRAWSTHLNLGAPLFESDLVGLPVGIQRIDGVLFDVRGFPAVAGTNRPPNFGTELLAPLVKVEAPRSKFSRLHALLLFWPGARGPASPAQTIALLRFHYADGTIASQPILEGRDVLNAIVGGSDPGGEAVAHVHPVWSPNGYYQRLCRATFTNSRPQAEVRHIEIESHPAFDGTLLIGGMTLETMPPLEILTHPSRQRVPPGQPAEFTVAAAHPAGVSYQWQRDETNIPGATNSTLRLPNVTADDAGLYRVGLALDPDAIVMTFSESAALEITEELAVRGLLRLEYWDTIQDKFLTNLTQHVSFPNSPDRTIALPHFEIPRHVAEHYGARITGFLLPPESGDYHFYLASDDQSQLFISSDDRPENKQLVAEETHWQSPRAWTAFRRRSGPVNQSKPLRLEKGKRYYLEALFKEGSVLDHFAVAWQMPGQPVPPNGSAPIPGRYLAAPDFEPLPEVP